LPMFHEYGNLCLQEMTNTLRNRIRAAFAALGDSLAQHFGRRMARIQRWQMEKDAAMGEQSSKIRPQIERVDSLVAQFTRLRKALV
jgi:hypothetical protein